MATRSGQHLIIASNRLPVRFSVSGGSFSVEPSAGGLASALGAVRGDAVWIGWPGTVVPPDLQGRVRGRLARSNLVPVFLTEDEEEDFYGRVCNDTLWPLLHYFGDRLRITPEAWQRYVQVNERFADAILERAGPGSRVWVHDFHLMLVPAILRRRAPDLAVGFFLHTPFPSSEVYRLLPSREEVLRGMLGADYVSFQTGDYARHFRSSCLRVLGIDSTPDWLELDGRRVGLGVDPVGIDTEGFRRVLRDPETARLLAQLEERYAGRKLVLGVERLDYTKGIPQKLLAFERFLEQDPTRARTTAMLQVLVPSRLESPGYRQQRDEIELLIARINGRFAQPGITPVEYFHRAISKPALVALYRRADVMMVTPLRDGMNLVAHEFVFCQSAPGVPSRWRGALLLSEFAGAAQVLPGALLVNPWNVDGVVEHLARALELPAAERRRRLETMSRRVEALDCRRWADGFLGRLGRYARRDRRRRLRPPPTVDAELTARLRRRFARARRRTILLDYDGTLRELEPHPDLAAPTPDIRALLRHLASVPATDVHIVSGRRRRNLEAWFGQLPVYLCAEHGYFAREPGGEWRTLVELDLSWMRPIERLLRRTAAEVPGTHVERKACSVAWHYREAEPEYGSWRARELLNDLNRHLAGAPAEILQGHRVVEVRARGVDKGLYVRSLFPNGREPGHFVIGLGDDRTDHDLLDALPPGSVAGHVGGLLPRSRDPAGRREHIRIVGPGEVRVFLRELVADALPGPRQARGAAQSATAPAS
ncbi:MAG TPA: bifunctional alpha,alpha-trehalose-phosphate synthase (UDP-forming)/trehalose-phosphatase [Gaiellaceae bacterium]|nr:bifunctional alpha,alpha-trehalose-phosphate synthase (UDP-forming)/trehalose-phosphatase [Gaiellaceae bacterium]